MLQNNIFFKPEDLIFKKKIKNKTLTINLERSFQEYEMFTDSDLYAAKGNVFICDTETYSNFFLIAFQCYTTKKVIYFKVTDKDQLDVHKLLWVLHNTCVVTFNGNSYDLPMIWLALTGVETTTLKFVSDQIIKSNWRQKDIEQTYRFKCGNVNHVDIIEVAPLQASLKTYGGRLNATRLQDLPFDPSQILTDKEIEIVTNYCVNDLKTTALLLTELCPQLELRAQLSEQYRQDLRSKSDAQIAEAVIAKEVERLNGYWAKRPVIDPGTSFKYNVPDYISYKSPLLQRMLEVVRAADFVVADNGSILEPPEFAQLKELQVGHSKYRMGLGGLHSTEEQVCHVSTDKVKLYDVDATSFYPQIILNQKLYPKHLTPNFLVVYENIVQRRIAAKKEGNKVVADSLKITINGSFGKFGSKYSSLYSPDLMLQVTVSGQLTLLMLIEMIELAGIPVISGNTDGIIIESNIELYEYLNIVIHEWELITGFQSEETRYKSVYSKDVNNYLAVKEDGTCKGKGAYSKPGLQKNPTSLICIDAVTALLVGNTPIEETIITCKDINKFLTVRNVKGGAEKDGIYLGKTVRWIYSNETTGQISYAMNGNKVPKSEGARPLMDLPPLFPTDIDYERYLNDTKQILIDIGHTKVEKQMTFF